MNIKQDREATTHFELDLENIKKDEDGTIISADLKGISMATDSEAADAPLCNLHSTPLSEADNYRKAAYKAVDAYLDAGGPSASDLVIMSRTDWERNAKLAGVMTGQEWYDRFVEEKRVHLVNFPHSKEKDWINNAVESAAKRAAGIE